MLHHNFRDMQQAPICCIFFVQAFLTHLLTVDLPKLMVLPKRLEINIPPAVTAVAEAAVGRDVVMRAVASAVLQADALENALIAALPLGPQSAAGGVSLPASFQGELQVRPVFVSQFRPVSHCRIGLCLIATYWNLNSQTLASGHRRCHAAASAATSPKKIVEATSMYGPVPLQLWQPQQSKPATGVRVQLSQTQNLYSVSCDVCRIAHPLFVQ